MNEQTDEMKKVLLVEPFYGGSHKQLMDVLAKHVKNHTLITLKAKKWHWRARCSALILSGLIPDVTSETAMFCSSVVNLAELVGLRPDLAKLRKIVYFHENQLIYPVQAIKARDVQFQYNEILTCLAADIVIFNSNFNKESFLSNISTVIKLLPDYRPKNLIEKIEPKCRVIYFPISFPIMEQKTRPALLHIIWPHRWEFDKNPKEFFNVLFKLKGQCKNFVVSLLGEIYTDIPDIFPRAKEFLQEEIINYGYMESREDYLKTLATGHVVISTSNHEFFGVAMLEATYLGCLPLVPDRLVYPEIYPKECLYKSEDELLKMLCEFCDKPQKAVITREEMQIDMSKYSEEEVLPNFVKLFNE